MLTDLLLQNEAAFQVVRLTGAALLIGMGAVTLWSAWRGERTRRKEWSRGNRALGAGVPSRPPDPGVRPPHHLLGLGIQVATQ